MGSRTDVASRDWIARAGLASCVLAQLVVVGAESRCTLLCGRSCAVPAPVTPPLSSLRSIGLWVPGVESRRGTGFRRSSCRIAVFICDRAVICCRCRSLCSLFCDCSCAVPASVILPHSSSLSIGLWVSWVFVLESRADVASRGWVSANFMPDHRHHMWPRCCLLSVPITLLVVL